MSQIQAFANNHSTQFAQTLSTLIQQHISPHPQLTTQFNQFNHSMYLHRVLYAYHKYSFKHSRHKPSMQAAYVRMLQNNPQLLINAANTPTAHF
jgi:hypothetical protein